jgi:hypothetical protein
MKIRRLVVAVTTLVMGCGAMCLQAEQAKPPGKERRTQVASAPGKVWRSTTTGREYRVLVEKDIVHTEWVNLPPVLAQGGAYVRSQSRREGARWLGTVRSYLPCETVEANERVSNRCHLETKIEIDSMTADRITGRAQDLRKFDCKACRVIEAAWADFLWIPKGR